MVSPNGESIARTSIDTHNGPACLRAILFPLSLAIILL